MKYRVTLFEVRTYFAIREIDADSYNEAHTVAEELLESINFPDDQIFDIENSGINEIEEIS